MHTGLSLVFWDGVGPPSFNRLLNPFLEYYSYDNETLAANGT